MSQQERVIGKLKKVMSGTGKDVQDWAKEKYCILEGDVYEVLELTCSDDQDFCNVREVDGILEFDTSYYNGGTYWAEMVEDALKEKKW